mmetsp:Transcript_5505/g.17646  ORF Transcript_5505/g.17646 Transcript_5505/m.17646 type:complete len:228 (-) Transcript_5505:172-855(-)
MVEVVAGDMHQQVRVRRRAAHRVPGVVVEAVTCGTKERLEALEHHAPGQQHSLMGDGKRALEARPFVHQAVEHGKQRLSGALLLLQLLVRRGGGGLEAAEEAAASLWKGLIEHPFAGLHDALFRGLQRGTWLGDVLLHGLPEDLLGEVAARQRAELLGVLLERLNDLLPSMLAQYLGEVLCPVVDQGGHGAALCRGGGFPVHREVDEQGEGLSVRGGVLGRPDRARR